MKIKEKVLKEVKEDFTRELYGHTYAIEGYRQIVRNQVIKTINLTLAEVGKVIDDLGNIRESNFYDKVLSHRIKCSKWGKDFCLECFGFGLTKSRDSFYQELKQKLGIK